jgi:hypothetical protein
LVPERTSLIAAFKRILATPMPEGSRIRPPRVIHATADETVVRLRNPRVERVSPAPFPAAVAAGTFRRSEE